MNFGPFIKYVNSWVPLVQKEAIDSLTLNKQTNKQTNKQANKQINGYVIIFFRHYNRGLFVFSS